MLNRATKIMNKQREEREAAAEKARAIITDAQEALRILGFEEVSIDKVIDVKPIIINKGHIVTIETTNDEELDRLYEENRRHIRRINELAEESIQLENEIAFKDGQIVGLNKQVKELEDKIAELQSAINAKKLTKEKTNIKGGDAMTSNPEQPKRNPLLDKIKRAPEFTIEQAVESAQADAERKAKEKEEAKSQFPKYSLEYEQITFDESMDSRTMFGVRGTITFDEASYFFEATNNHHMPIVYGCYDEDVIRLTKDIIMHEIERFSFMNEREVGAADYRYAKDETFPIVVWRLTDDKGNITYHGYSCTKQYSYILTWDKAKFNYVGRKLVKNAFSSEPNMWKKLSNEQLADKFRAVCASIWPEDFTNDDNDPEPTKDKKQHKNTKEFYQITKEQHQPTNDETIRVTKEQHESTNEQHQTTEDEISNMIHERHQRAKENRTQRTKEIIWDTPIDNIGETKDVNSTNDNVVDLTADADDLDF